MTPRDGFSRDMGPLALDAGTAERFMTGAVDVADAPPGYRAVAWMIQALREAPDSAELVGEPAAVERIATAVVVGRRTNAAPRSRRRRSLVARLAAAGVVALGLCVTGGLASAGTLPASAQNVASEVLGTVGIAVPTCAEDPVVDAPPTTTSTPAPPPSTSSVEPSPGASVPNVPAPHPEVSGPTPPGNGQGDAHGTEGTPPGTAKGQGDSNSPNDSPNGPPPGKRGNGNHR